MQTPRGTKDILPDEQPYWSWITGQFIKRASGLGFARIETPIFEYASVFTSGIGKETDIVTKEMFEVKRLTDTKQSEEIEKERLVLRPEGTAAIVRAYIEHGMQTWTQPVRLYYIEPMFRYDRPQRGRYRQHYQLGLEYFGDSEPAADALLILLCWQLMTNLGLDENSTVNINSVGDEVCRPKYRKKLKAYFEPYKAQLCPDCQQRLELNPLRILDCKEPQCQPFIANAPIILDELCPECKAHLGTLLEYLEELNISYNLTPNLVRGIDYYSRTVFEIVDTEDKTRQNSFGGGGRYDSLVKNLGGKETPAVGAGIGVERLIEKLQAKGSKPPPPAPLDVVVVPLGEKAKRAGLKLIADLSRWDFSASGAFAKESLKAQLKYADKLECPLAVIIGTREVFDRSVIIRDMKTGVQDTISYDYLEEVLKERLKT